MSPLLKKTSFDSSKCVSLLELTLKRIKILKNKRLIIAKQSRDDVAKLLQKGQEANAVARVEHAFREQNIAGAYDLLEQYCQLIIKRISAVKSQQECPSELKEAIASLIYAAPRCGDLLELQKLRDILASKYGAEYASAALELRPECSVNQQIIQKLSSRPPNSDTRLNLLKEIATEYKIDWNYQKAVAASFKNGESSMQDKQKVSRSPSEVSKEAVSTINIDNEKPTTSVSMHQKEQASSAAHIAIPSKSNSSKSEPGDVLRANQVSDVAQQPAVADIQKPAFDSFHPDGSRKSHASAAAQNAIPSTTHSGNPKAREFVGASKRRNVGSPTAADKEKPHDVSVHQVNSKEKESVPAHVDAVSSTIHKAPSRSQKEFMGSSDTDLHSSANKQQPSLMHAHRHELKGRSVIPNPSRNPNSPYEEKGSASPSHLGMPGFVEKVKPASVVTRPDGLMEKGNSVLPSTVSRPKASVDSIQEPDVSVSKSSERRKSELDESKGQASNSTQGIYQAGFVSSKATPHSILNHETNGTAESLAAKQYMRAHKSYIKADIGEGEGDHRSMENSGINLRPKHVAHGPDGDPYARLRQEGKMDYKNLSHSYKQVPDPKRAPRAMDEEDDSSSYEYYAREQPIGAHNRRRSNALSHEGASFSQMSKESDLGGKKAFSSQGRHQVEEGSFNYHRNPSTLREPSNGQATRLSTHSELERDLADPDAATENAIVSAARTADAAIDMVRTVSMRSKADRKVGDVKASEREGFPKTSFNSSRRDGCTSAEGLSGMMDSDCSLERRSSGGQQIRHAGGFQPIVQGLEDEHERKHYKHLSTHAEMLSIKAEVQVAPHVQKKMVLRSTQDLESETALYDTSIRKNQEPFSHSNMKNEQKKQENMSSHTEAHQIQEPDLYDSEMPQFDDYSSYESSEEEPPPYYPKGWENKKGAPNNGRNQSRSSIVGKGPVNFVNKSAHTSAKQNLQQEFSGSLDNDDRVESVEFSSPDAYNPQFDDEYEQSGNATRWRSAKPMRSHVSGMNTRKANVGMATHHDQEQQERSSASYGYVDEGAMRWGTSALEGPTRDVSKQRWKLTAAEEVNAQPSLQAHNIIRASQHDQPPAMATQAVTGKHVGISQRSVRSSRPTI